MMKDAEHRTKLKWASRGHASIYRMGNITDLICSVFSFNCFIGWYVRPWKKVRDHKSGKREAESFGTSKQPIDMASSAGTHVEDNVFASFKSPCGQHALDAFIRLR